MGYYKDLVEHFNVDEASIVVPTNGYPERDVSWFVDNILPDFLALKERFGWTGDLLDVGCAHGYFTRQFAPYFDSVTGIDFSDKRIEAAKKLNHAPNVTYKLVNIVTDVIHDKYDLAISSAVYQHIDVENDRKRAFEETHAALADGAYLVLYDEDLITRHDMWNGFYQPLDEPWVRNELKNLFELIEKPLICRGNHGEHIYRWVLKKI